MYTMYTYIKEEQEICREILKDRKKNLQSFLDLITQNKEVEKIVFIATGSSANAVNSAKYYVETLLNMEVDIKMPFLFSNYEKLYTKNPLIIAVSQSGKSFSTIEAVKKAKKLDYKNIVALTANLSSPIVKEVSCAVNIGCGEEKVGFVTKGFTSTVLTLMLMALEAAYVLKKISKATYDSELIKLESAIERIEDVIQRSDAWYERNKLELVQGERFVTIAYGASVGVAYESDTKITETVRCPISAHELEEYMHGPYLELNKNHFVFFVHTKGRIEDRMINLREYLKRTTSHCFTISHKEECEDVRTLALGYEDDENISPLLYVIPFQILSYRLAADKGIDLSVPIFSDFDAVLKSKV